MKLVIREYLSMLKERDELDRLIPDLLLNMGLTPTSRAQTGPRQFGVDIASKGVDSDGIEKLFLVTIKAGNITRSEWDRASQGIRPSINEILDFYIPKKISKKDQKLPIKIILCCNGDLKQEVVDNWTGYIDRETRKGLEFDFWGGDKLAELVEKYFLDEYIFQETEKKQLRKTLALIGDPDYDLKEYFDFLTQNFASLEALKTELTQKKVKKVLRLINLSLNIIFHWAKEEKSFKQALIAAERALLLAYSFNVQNKLDEKRQIAIAFSNLYSTYEAISIEYFKNIENHCYVRDGFYGYGIDKYDYPLRVFEIIGTLSTIGFHMIYMGAISKVEGYIQFANTISNALSSLIELNLSASVPLFDRNGIDICLALIFLKVSGKEAKASEWINKILENFVIGYRYGSHFPIYTDLYDDLIDLEEDKESYKKELTSISTLVPLLMQWIVILDNEYIHKRYKSVFRNEFSHTNFQIWYPEDDTKNFFYTSEITPYKSGIMLSSMEVPKEFERLVEQTKKAALWGAASENLPGFNKLRPLIHIASRHYKTPLPPISWHSFLPNATFDKVGRISGFKDD